ncbi:hypothetical protein JWG44_00070 [Leptospira sp. 201903071]|uniref:hypothetical protein n=1 Tax=Leptospira ainazelensis TaxID=2810034 RepID=UPI0019632B57|nr:hypothetical protein [Leptospira ainazelensis]MBM9498649.1 hypothetical protein [Leptospira ainazelensis]
MGKYRNLFICTVSCSLLACASVYKTGGRESIARSNDLEFNIGLTKELANLRFPEREGFSPDNPVFNESKFSSWLNINKITLSRVLGQMDAKNLIFININTAKGVGKSEQSNYCVDIDKKVLRGLEKGGLPVDRFVSSCRGAKETIPGFDPRSKINNRVTFAVGSLDESYEGRALVHQEKVKYAFDLRENVSVVVEGHVEVSGTLDLFGKDELKLIYGCTGFVNANDPIRYESKIIELTVTKKDFSVISIAANKEITKLECSMRVYDEDGFSRSEKETLIEFTEGMGGYIKELQDPPKGLDFFKSKVAPWLPLVPLFMKIFDLIDPNDSGDMVSIDLLKERGYAPTIYQVTEPDKTVRPIRLWFTVNVKSTNFDNPVR